MSAAPFQAESDHLKRLRARALALLEQQTEKDPTAPQMNLEVSQLLENMRIYQVELELQNEELRRAQQEAELSQVRYRSLFEQLPMPALVVNAGGVVQQANERALALLGKANSFTSADNRLFQRLSREDRARLHVAIRDVAPGQPQVVAHLDLSGKAPTRQIYDAHLIQLSLTYHLDGHAMILLVDRTAEALLEQDRHFFSLLLDSSDSFIFAADTQGKMILANAAMLQFLGRQREEVIGQSREQFLPLQDAVRHRASDEAVLRTGQPITLEEKLHAGGNRSNREFLTRKFALHDLKGISYGVAGISSDMTELKEQQRQALLSESVFMTASEGILITDKDARIIRVNPAFCRISGFSESSVLGHRPNILKSGRQDASFFEGMWQALNSEGKWAGEISNRSADGRIFTIWSSINAIFDEHGRVSNYMAIQTDLTQLREAQTQLERLASYDNLTGLPNRALFTDRINLLAAHAHRYRKTFAVLFVDLDRFKEVNDSLGHHIGDELLKCVALRLQHGVRSEDTVARMGGDEFVILLPGADSTTAQQVANKLLEALRAPMPLGTLVAYQPQASLGIAIYPKDGLATDILLRNADIAMYAAKMAGRNCSAAFDPQMSEDNERIFAIQAELSAGIEQKELRLYFQPKFSLDSGELQGAEALVRWERPGHGLLSPAEFIPIAEKSGLIVAIDLWVMKEALRQIGDWQKRGLWKPSWRIAINQNASDLRRNNMMSDLKAALQENEVAAATLELEITEGALLEHTREMILQLTAIKDLGISLAIDDFGTGYSSLAYLSKLPISVIKIDRSFISDMLIKDSDRVLVETIIAMAHNLGHELVAEGVEHPAQRQRLAELGCQLGQGFLFGAPMDGTSFEARFLQAELPT